MFLFENTAQVFNDPWPHLVINNALPEDVANYMRDHFPEPGPSEKEQKYNQRRGGFIDDKVYDDFRLLHQLKADDIFEIVDNAFGDLTTDEYCLSDFTYRKQPPQWPPVLIKDWHTDLPDKKYHAMLYLGSGQGGWYELLDKRRNIEKRYPYEHNRLIVWRNTDDTFHRFWSSDNCRQTIGFAIEYK